MKNPFHAGSVVVAAMIFAIMASSISAPALLFTQTAIASTEGQSGTTIATGTTAPTAPNNAITKRVAVGGGNITLSINQFSPQTVEIQPGESVTFFAPEDSFEVHNIRYWDAFYIASRRVIYRSVYRRRRNTITCATI